jgi:putative transposase
MNHWKPELQAIDVSAWPTVARTELDEAARRAFEKRRQAVVRYAAGESVKSIELSTGVNRRQLYRLLERATLPHPDGRPFGFRALVRYTRIAEYTRVRAVETGRGRGRYGAAGALSLLFEQYPALAGWLLGRLKQRKVLLVQIHTDSGLRTRLSGLGALHDEFLRQCRTVGLTVADYPFNTSDHAIRSLSRRVKVELLHGFDTAARSAGASHLKGLPRPNEAGVPAATRPYQVVEFDGHRLDIRLKVLARDPLGFEHEFEIDRAWLLVIIDVCTRAVLGYHIAPSLLAREKRWTSAGALKMLASAVCGVSIRLAEKVDRTTVGVFIFRRKFCMVVSPIKPGLRPCWSVSSHRASRVRYAGLRPPLTRSTVSQNHGRI